MIEFASSLLFSGPGCLHERSELFPYLVLVGYPALALHSGVEVSSACDSIKNYASTMAAASVRDTKSKALIDVVLANNLGFSVAGERLGASRALRVLTLIVWGILVVFNAASARAV